MIDVIIIDHEDRPGHPKSWAMLIQDQEHLPDCSVWAELRKEREL